MRAHRLGRPLALLLLLLALLAGARAGFSWLTAHSLAADQAFLLAGGLLVAAAWLVCATQLNRAAAPFKQVRQAAAAMASGHPEVRAPADGDDEAALLGRTINRLADEVRRSVVRVTDEKNKLDAILSSMADGVVTFQGDGTITFANSTAAGFLNTPPTSGRGPRSTEEAAGGLATMEGPSPLIGENLYSHLPIRELATDAIEARESVRTDLRRGELELSLFLIPLRGGASPDPDEVMLLVRDVTSLRQVEIARSQFLGNVSHELKTPLTIIKGFVVTLLKSPGIPAEWKRYLDYIDRETDRLTRLVNDLLNLARLRSKRTQMHFTFCEPLELLRDTWRQMLAQAARHDVTLTFEAPCELPALLADTDRLREVVINLVDNAFKYSPPQTQVRLEAASDAEHLMITVRDSGAGIPPDEVPFLFERFFRGSEKGGRKAGGSGIGLAIVKEIIDAHHGEIHVESRVGTGTSFVITLPLRRLGPRGGEA